MNRYFGLHTLEGEWHSLLPRYLLLADRVEGRRILDIGCGSGIGSSMLLELGAEMVDAIDHRPAVLELARMKHAKQGLDFHVMFWEELDFPDDTFDAVLCLDPSSPVTDPSLIAEVQRVMKPGGEYICAIERKQIDGLEVTLPRYGYADAAENIDVHPTERRPPQVGELSASFPKIASVIQRPVLSYVFDVDRPRSSGESMRKVSDAGESGTWEQEEGGEGRWITIDDTLQRRDADEAAVELWFCGPDDNPPPPLREVRLPYFGLVERLHQVINELQMQQVRGSETDESIFNEIVNDDEGRQREITNEYRVVDWDDEPTDVRNRDELSPESSTASTTSTAAVPDDAMADHRDQLESQLQELSALYQQVRNEFQTVVQDAQSALDERDRYIEHLVGQVREWQKRVTDTNGEHEDFDELGEFGGLDALEERTTVYESGDSRDEEKEDAAPSGKTREFPAGGRFEEEETPESELGDLESSELSGESVIPEDEEEKQDEKSEDEGDTAASRSSEDSEAGEEADKQEEDESSDTSGGEEPDADADADETGSDAAEEEDGEDDERSGSEDAAAKSDDSPTKADSEEE